MEILIRKIKLMDAEYVHDLSVQLGYEPGMEITKTGIKAILKSKNNCALVAIADGKVIAWIHAFKAVRLESACFIEIGGLVVDKNFRGKGVGKNLVEKIKIWCRSEQIATIKVRSNVRRNEAHQFYYRIGFNEIKQQKVFETEIC